VKTDAQLQRDEAACARALAVGGRSYRHVEAILKRGADRVPLPTQTVLALPTHEQLAPKHRHEYLGDPTLADAIRDRVLHRAHRIELRGESLRKGHPKAERRARDARPRRCSTATRMRH
jgi:hypothetical protein